MDDYISREAVLSAQNKSMNLREFGIRLERLPAADVRPVAEWISDKDSVCAFDGCVQRVTMCWFRQQSHFVLTGRVTYWRVTHWLPLPEPPKEKGNVGNQK